MENNVMTGNRYLCRQTRKNNHNINYMRMRTRNKLLLLLLAGMIGIPTYGQTTTPSSSYNQTDNKKYDGVDEQPSFPGGQNALFAFLAENIVYPAMAAENGIGGRVEVEFIVEKDGSITGVHVKRGVDPLLDREAVRVVSKMPKWIPGKVGGKIVRFKYTVPVTFR